MRQIKFRAWDKESSTMISSDKLGGVKDFFLDFNNQGLGLWIAIEDEHPEKRDAELMQFTGLLDKNGKEIYEGDYLKVNNEQTLEVTWCNGAFKYQECASMMNLRFGDGWLHELQTHCQCFKPIPQKNLEIIGNIYENSKLLK